MAVTFQTKTVPAPDNSLIGFDIPLNGYVMFTPSWGTMASSSPQGWLQGTILYSMQFSRSSPTSGNIAGTTADFIECGFCKGTANAPGTAGFLAAAARHSGLWTGYGTPNTHWNPATNIAVTWKSGAATTGGGISSTWPTRHETGTCYPEPNAISLQKSATDHYIVKDWPIYIGIGAYTPLSVMRMFNHEGNWGPRDVINRYAQQELALGAQAGNPALGNVYPLTTDMDQLDSVYFWNNLAAGSGVSWRIYIPKVDRQWRA
jgi:hypothetical protein